MATYVKFNNDNILYPATIGGRMSDKDWDGRASKFIHMELTYEEAVALFANEVKWSIVQDVEHEIEVVDEETNEISVKLVTEQEVYDNSEYSILGDITIHNNGTITVKMGKPTAEEKADALEAAVNMLLMPDVSEV